MSPSEHWREGFNSISNIKSLNKGSEENTQNIFEVIQNQIKVISQELINNEVNLRNIFSFKVNEEENDKKIEIINSINQILNGKYDEKFKIDKIKKLSNQGGFVSIETLLSPETNTNNKTKQPINTEPNPEEILINPKNDLQIHIKEEKVNQKIQEQEKTFWEKIGGLF